MALSLGELFGTIGLDASEYKTKLKDAQKDLKDFGTAGVVAAGAAATAIGVALGKGIVDNLNIDAGNRKLKAQLNLTEAESAKAGKAAGALFAGNYGESMADVQAATGAVMSSIGGMRDASQADLEDITGKALSLATAFDVDVAEAATTAGILMKSGLAKDATEAMDLIAGGMQGVPESLRGEILPLMDEYGSRFAALGFDGETAMGLIISSTQDGAISMDKIGDSVKELGISLGDGAKSDFFKDIKLDQKELFEQMQAGGPEAEKALGSIVHGLQNIKDPSEQAAAAIGVFGTPLEDLGTEQIPEFLGQIDPMGDAFDSLAGSADNVEKALSEGPSAGFDSFKRQAHAGLIDVVNFALMPAVTDFANHLNTTIGPAITDAANWIMTDMMPALQRFSDWFGENQGTISLWAGVVGAVLFPIFARILVELGIQVWAWAVAGAGAIKTAALYVVNSYKMVGAWIRMGAAAIVSGAQTAYVWLLYRVEAAKTAAAMVVNAAKIVAQWVVMATGATVNAVKMAAAWVVGVITGAARAVAAMIVTAAQYVAQWVIMAVQSGIQALRMAAAWVVGVGIPAVGAGIMMGIQAAIVVGAWILMATQATIQAVRMAAAWFIALGPIGWITAAIIGLVALVILNWEKVSTFTSSAWAAIVGFISEAWANIVSGVSTGIDNVIGFFTGLPGRILGALGNLGNLLLDAGGQILDGFLKGLTQGFENVKNFVGGIGTWIADHKGPKRYDLGLLVPAGGWIMDGLGTGIENSMPALGSQLSDVSWMIQNGIDPELQGSGQYAFSSTAGSAGPPNGPGGSGTPLTLAPTISGADDPEETWRVFKSRANESLAAQGSDVRLS